jgi:hypothetical protein
MGATPWRSAVVAAFFWFMVYCDIGPRPLRIGAILIALYTVFAWAGALPEPAAWPDAIRGLCSRPVASL